MKKNRLLKLVSSICGVVAICGVFGLSLLGNKKVQESKADSVVVDNGTIFTTAYYTGNFDYETRNMSRGETINGDTIVYVTGDYTYFKSYLNNVETYSIQYHITNLLFVNSYLNKGFKFPRDGSSMNWYFSSPFSESYSQDLSLVISNLSFYYSSASYVTFDANFNIYDRVNDNYIVPTEGVFRTPSHAVFVDNPQTDTAHLQLEMSYNNNYGYGGNVTSFDDVYSNFYVPFSIVNLSVEDTQNADYSSGYSTGYSSGYTDGYNSGYQGGYNNGYSQGFSDGVYTQQPLIDDAYNNGYSQGFSDGVNSDATAVTIFSGILQVGLLPINFFLSVFNFEVFGINIGGFIKAILTICLTIIVVKSVLGNSGGAS